MVMRGLAQKADLFSVTPAPFADQQMKPQTDPLCGRKRLVKSVALHSGNLPAGGHESA
jgi:hypothetical protein